VAFQLDPHGQGWSALPAPPMTPRDQMGIASARGTIVLWGGRMLGSGGAPLADGVAFAASSRSWQPLPAAPLTPRTPAVVQPMGDDVVFWGNSSAPHGDRHGAAYDTRKGTWRKLPDAPYAMNRASSVWTGDALVIVGGLVDQQGRPSSSTSRAMAYMPSSNSWHPLDPAPLWPQAGALAWNQRELVGVDYMLRTVTGSTRTRSWAALTKPPLDAAECNPTAAATHGGDVVLWYCTRGALWRSAAASWRVLPRPPCHCILNGPVIRGDDAAFVVGGEAVHPPPTDVGALWVYRAP